MVKEKNGVGRLGARVHAISTRLAWGREENLSTGPSPNCTHTKVNYLPHTYDNYQEPLIIDCGVDVGWRRATGPCIISF